MVNLKSAYFLVSTLFLSSLLSAQIHCGVVELVPNTTINEIITFDNFTKYNGGIIVNSIARIKINIEDKVVVDPLCSWHLTMQVDNNGTVPMTEWEELLGYGGGLGNNPTIDQMEIRVRNACTTSPSDGVFRTFTNDMDILDIIAAGLPVTAAGSCVDNVNGVGSYLTNYNEYHFDIDVRIDPGFNFNPGIFQLNITFHLEENP